MESKMASLSNSHRASRITLVLGGGWKLGCSFHSGVILAMKEVWGIDARRVDAVIGTSSGAVVGGLLGAGMSPEDMFCRETVDDLSPAGQTLMAQVDRSADSLFGDSPGIDTAAVRRTQKLHRSLGLSPRAALAALLPRGRKSMGAVEGYFDDLIGPSWPTDIDLRLCAVDLGTGERVALDRNSGATVGQAVAASCSVPGVSRPVPIRDREYVDGAVYSINNADLAVQTRDDPIEADSAETTIGSQRHTVIISAPLSVNRLRIPFSPLGVIRNAMHLQTAAEVRKLCNIDQVIVVEPTRADSAAMGPDLNANERRSRVAHSALANAVAVFDATQLQGLPTDSRTYSLA